MSITTPDSLQTWSSSSYIQAIAEQGKISQINNMELIIPGNPLASGVENFCIYLEQNATVTFTTVGGQTVSVSLAAGYHPIRIKSVGLSSTSDPIYACW